MLILTFLGAFFLLNSIPFTNTLVSSLYQDDVISSFSTSRIYDIALLMRDYSQNIILQYPAFIVKSIIFLFAPILRPLSIFVSPLPLLDVGYSIIASLIFPFNLSLILVFLFFVKTKKRKYTWFSPMVINLYSNTDLFVSIVC